MKYLKYTGLYFAMIALGDNILKLAEASSGWVAIFYGGSLLWFMGTMWEKDS